MIHDHLKLMADEEKKLMNSIASSITSNIINTETIIRPPSSSDPLGGTTPTPKDDRKTESSSLESRPARQDFAINHQALSLISGLRGPMSLPLTSKPSTTPSPLRDEAYNPQTRSKDNLVTAPFPLGEKVSKPAKKRPRTEKSKSSSESE